MYGYYKYGNLAGIAIKKLFRESKSKILSLIVIPIYYSVCKINKNIVKWRK